MIWAIAVAVVLVVAFLVWFCSDLDMLADDDAEEWY